MTATVSAPWATEADLPQTKPTPPAPWAWADLLLLASEVLYELTGRRWRGAGRCAVRLVDRPAPRAVPPWVPAAVGDGPDGWAPLYGGGGAGPTVVVLPATPVRPPSVAVHLGETATLDPGRYTCSRAGVLERTDGDPWPVNGTCTVDYVAGTRPPAGGRYACVALAVELAKLAPGSTARVSSRLGNVVTQVVREGVSAQTGEVAAVNLRDAITTGMTGLPEVDLWITSVGGRSRGGQVWSPDLTRPVAAGSP